MTLNKNFEFLQNIRSIKEEKAREHDEISDFRKAL